MTSNKFTAYLLEEIPDLEFPLLLPLDLLEELRRWKRGNIEYDFETEYLDHGLLDRHGKDAANGFSLPSRRK